MESVEALCSVRNQHFHSKEGDRRQWVKIVHPKEALCSVWNQHRCVEVHSKEGVQCAAADTLSIHGTETLPFQKRLHPNAHLLDVGY